MYETVPAGGPATDELLGVWRSVLANGGVLLTRVRWTGPRTDEWFRTSAKVFEYESFRCLLDSAAVRTALPELRIPEPYPISSPPEFPQNPPGTLTLDGEIAGNVVAGGAYERFRGTAKEAKQLATAAVSELTQDRHEDFNVFVSFEPWTPWFYDVAWDCTWIMVDRRLREATLLVATDTD
jgi:hypothetical protein